MNFKKSIYTAVLMFMIVSGILLGSPVERKMSVVINFDVEDYITPSSEGIDDIPKWLAEIMRQEGVTGTFFVIGEKARSLEERGRMDVISAMAGHDIGSHTNFGSIHPTVTEQLESAEFFDGLALMRKQESAGIKELERIFGVPVRILARHGGSYGPQLVCALGGMKAGYAGSPVFLPGHQVVWFCNALNFFGQYDGYDDTYYLDELFEIQLGKTMLEIPKLAKTTSVLPIFAGHPCKIRTMQFWDMNFYRGVNTEPEAWKTPDMRPLESMQTAQKNFRRLIRFLKSREDLEITTFAALMDRYSHQKERIESKDLIRIAQEIIKMNSIIFPDDYSPAEIFSALADSLSIYRETSRIPLTVSVLTRPLGPVKMPIIRPEIDRVNGSGALNLACEARDFIRSNHCLPDSLSLEKHRIGTGSLLALFCSVYSDILEQKTADGYDIIPFEPYPVKHEDAITNNVAGYKSWPVHRPDLDMSRIITLTKLQLWTLKPAHETEDSQTSR